MAVDRRKILGGAALFLGAAGVASSSLFESTPVARGGLRDHAARRGLTFGTAVRVQELQDPRFAQVVTRECSMIVPEVALKWGVTEPQERQYRFRSADLITKWTLEKGLLLRGHAGFWYRSMPSWALARPDKAPEIAVARVSAVVSRYKGKIAEWDVVNEAVEPRDGEPGGLRKAPFINSPNIGFIENCFFAAQQADENANLFYNDYGMEYDTAEEDARRTAVLRLLTALRKRGVPVHGLGLQTHVGVGRRFNDTKYRSFLKEIADLGLIIRLTEFDVADRNAPADIASRDDLVAAHGKAILDTAFDERAVKGLICWGLKDEDSWLKASGRRRDGLPPRPLPLDDSLTRKPLWSAIAAAFDGAPLR